MNHTVEIIQAYVRGEIGLEECNEKLAAVGSGTMLDPDRAKLTPEMIKEGWGLLDTGTGYLDPVLVKDMELQNADCGEMVAFCFLMGKMYEVQGTKLVDLK